MALGIVTMGCTSILPYFKQVQFLFFDTRRQAKDPIGDFEFSFILTLGIFLMLIQAKALLLMLLPQSFARKGRMSSLAFILVPGMAKAEMATKKAARFKISKMITEAMALHEGTLAGSSLHTSLKAKNNPLKDSNPFATGVNGYGDAMLNFHAIADDHESYGGVLWCWKGMWKGTIWSEEGIWIHARLYAMNCVQFLICGLYAAVYIAATQNASSILNPSAESMSPSLSPHSTAYSPPPPTYFPMPTMYPSQNMNTPSPVNRRALEAASYINAIADDVWKVLAHDLITDELQIRFSYVESGSVGIGPTNVNQTSIHNSTRFLEFRDLQLPPNPTVSPSAISTARPSTLSANATLAPSLNPYSSNLPIQPAASPTSTPSESNPKKWQVAVAIGVGGTSALAATLSLSIIWIPSAVSTILRFRSGQICNLLDPEFARYR